MSAQRLWLITASRVVDLIESALKIEGAFLDARYARVVLRRDGSIDLMMREPEDPMAIVGPDGVTCVFLREDSGAYQDWACGVTAGRRSQHTCTAQFAEKLASALIKRLKANSTSA